MKIGMLGTGLVARTVADKLLQLGHEVRMGSRTATNSDAQAWAKQNPERATFGTFADAAAFGQLLFNCTNGAHSLEALRAAGASRLDGKVLVDVANPLDLTKGMPPSLLVCNTDSLGEQIQRAFPKARVVKALNTMNVALMVDPQSLRNAEHTVFVAGDDPAAKATVGDLLRQFGWKHVLDVGDIKAARGTEAYVLLWASMRSSLKTANFNVHVSR